MYSQLSLIFVVLFSGHASRAKHTENGSVHSAEAASIFAFILLALYVAFIIVLVKNRHLVIKDGNNNNNTAATDAGNGVDLEGKGNTAAGSGVDVSHVNVSTDNPVVVASPVLNPVSV